MRIGFVWTDFASYMADCWRALASHEGIDLRIWVEQNRGSNTSFDPADLMRGLYFSYEYGDLVTGEKCRQVEAEVVEFKPDVLFICGWARVLPPYLAKSSRLRNIPKVLCCDMPWEWKPRKIAARFVLCRHLRRFQKIFVPGKQAAMYSRWLGFRPENIVCGEYGIDVEKFAAQGGGAVRRRGFVFVGRMVDAKGIQTLAAAYALYREQGGAWPLDVYGEGEQRIVFEGIDGVTVHGFAQPSELARIYSESRAFVLASKWDPWPLVILEACASGLPVICTHNCWNRHELVKENGLVVPVGSATGLAAAMLDFEHGTIALAGERGRVLASAYSCEKWCGRVLAMVNDLQKV